MSAPEAFVVSAARTAIGTFGSSLKNVPLADLAITAARAALKQSGVNPAQIGHMVMGNVVPTEPSDAYLPRVAPINADIPIDTPVYDVNRLCGSGLQAVISAAQMLLLGDTDIVIGAGAESMSRGPYLISAARWRARMASSTLHHNFPKLTGTSPVQYQKSLRLQAARIMMLTDRVDVNTAAFRWAMRASPSSAANIPGASVPHP